MQRILQEIMKKKILGTSDAWSIRQSSHQPSNPAYYIEDCRIFIEIFESNFINICATLCMDTPRVQKQHLNLLH